MAPRHGRPGLAGDYEPDDFLVSVSTQFPRLCLVLAWLEGPSDDTGSTLIYRGRSRSYQLPEERADELYPDPDASPDEDEMFTLTVEAHGRALDDVGAHGEPAVGRILRGVRREVRTVKALIVRQPWVERILSGAKTWELRGSRTHVRGPIALIEAGTGHVVGTAELRDVIGPLSQAALSRTTRYHAIAPQALRGG